MQNSFTYLDILIFGVIAIFLIFRLKNVLGTKTGYDNTDPEKGKDKKQQSNIIPFKSDKDVVNTDIADEIIKIDGTFNLEDFLSGSRIFFKMILESFVSGDLSNVKGFIKPSVLKSFKVVIDERNKEQETLIIDLKSIIKNEISSYKTTKSSIKISVVFESLQIKALMDKSDELIDGNIDKEILVKDVWIFERQINFKNPNWTLVETKSV
jgi:predicted lipid-binding transport protein (Tim44 family)